MPGAWAARVALFSEGRVGSPRGSLIDLKKEEERFLRLWRFNYVGHTISMAASELARVGRSVEGPSSLGASVLKTGCCFL